MRGLKKLIVASALGGLASLAIGSAASAQVCGLSGSTTTSIGNYDPFAGVAINNVNVTLRINRVVVSNAKKTQHGAFYLTQPAGGPAYQVLAAGGEDILHTEGGSVPTMSTTADGTGYLHHNFGSANSPDFVDFPITVSIPGSIDLVAGDPIKFDIYFVCNGTGGLGDVTTATKSTGAISLTLNVLSALQASYVGSALDFGEIGDLAANLAGASVGDTRRTGQIRVASTGPYTVDVASEKGYRMVRTGGNATPSGPDNIAYSFTMLGQTRNSANPTFTQKHCQRATLTGLNLAVQADLLEGGAAKLNGSYSDNVNVTITPLATPPFAGTSGDFCS